MTFSFYFFFIPAYLAAVISGAYFGYAAGKRAWRLERIALRSHIAGLLEVQAELSLRAQECAEAYRKVAGVERPADRLAGVERPADRLAGNGDST